MDALPFCKVTLRRLRCPWGPYSTEKKGYPATPKTMGEEIRKRRLDLNLRQIDAARIIGCDEMTVVNWRRDMPPLAFTICKKSSNSSASTRTKSVTPWRSG